jgi:putative hydrolase of the HAD superfamily
MMAEIKAVAFDIDGTLYADWRLYIRIVFYFIKHFSFFTKYNKVRHILHQSAPLADFYEYQARLLAKIMYTTPEHAKDEIEKVCYEGLKPYFVKIKPYKQVYETVCAFKSAGLKIAILSDFPPEQKGRVWGIRSLCDVCLGTEEVGALKPSPYPFGILAQQLNLKPEEILYVGNSIKYDVRGANNAKMKSAYKMNFMHRLFNRPCKEADISFKTYRQLRNNVLQ